MLTILISLGVRISPFHGEDPSSILGWGKKIFAKNFFDSVGEDISKLFKEEDEK